MVDCETPLDAGGNPYCIPVGGGGTNGTGAIAAAAFSIAFVIAGNEVLLETSLVLDCEGNKDG